MLVLLGVLVFIFKEFLSTTRLDFSKVNLSDALGRQRNAGAKPVNAHLVGMSGDVVRLNDDGERPMTVRLGSELWPARLDAAESLDPDFANPAVGERVVVTAVDGPVVRVVSAG